MRGFARRAYIALRHLPQFVVALAILAAMPAMAQQAAVQKRPDVPYGPYPAEISDLYIPATPATRRPAVVVIHGGGWVSGSRYPNEYFCNVLASMGVVVLNIDYRLADKANPATRWPAQLLDAQLAVRFLRAHAAELGIDAGRIGAVGDSAGAQLAVFLGALHTNVAGDVAGMFANQRPDVKAVIDQYGPMDLPGMGQYGIGSIDAMFGTITPPPGDLQSASPLPSITSRTAPIYIIHGQRDQVVPFDSSNQLVAALKAHNVAYQFVPFDGDHAYGGLTSDQVGKLQYDSLVWLVAQLKR